MVVTIAIVFPVQRTRRSSTRRQRAVYLSEVPTTATRQLFPKCRYPKSKLISTVKGIFIPGIFRYKEDLFFEVRIHPHPKGRGRGLSAPNFGVPFYLCVHPLLQNYQIDVVTYVERGAGFWGQLRLPSQESGVPGLPSFGGFPVFMPTPFNAERPNLAWWHIVAWELYCSICIFATFEIFAK